MNQEPKVYRNSGKIIIEMPEDNLIFAVENAPGYSAKVTDPDAYLDGVVARILEHSFGTDDDPMLFRLFDEVTEKMIEDGEPGVELIEHE